MYVPKAYLASECGFSEAGKLFHYQVLVPLVTTCGFEVMDPWKLTSAEEISAPEVFAVGSKERVDAYHALNLLIGRRNDRAIRAASVVVAVLDGSDVESGVAAEVGYAYGIKKRIIGYRSDFRLSGENEQTKVSLQLGYFISESGGKIVSTQELLKDALVAEYKRWVV